MPDGANLDAMIAREDFAADVSGAQRGTEDTRISMTHLVGDNFWVQCLRKPDFQRETVNWSPQKVVDLIAAFLDQDLIPAIILWRSGHLAFVIDGAHRLGAMLAWIRDDYGDRARSLAQFTGQVPEEQLQLAMETRTLVEEQVGPYSLYRDMWEKIQSTPIPPNYQKRMGGFQLNSFVAQWVPAVNADGAQRAFFKINQAQTPIDPTEQKILEHRRSPSAIVSRAIHRGGTGHPYWSRFDAAVQGEIQALGKAIHKALYDPPLGGAAIKSSDVPVAGRGYSSLPFVFDLVNLTNGVSLAKHKPTSRRVKVSRRRNVDAPAVLPENASLADDADGTRCLAFLREVQQRVRIITTDHPSSLGLHPLVYFYTRGGKFQPNTFLSILPVIDRLIQSGRLNQFCAIRRPFEDFILEHKEAFTLLVKTQGSGHRSRPAVGQFLEFVMERMWAGKSAADIMEELAADDRYHQLAKAQPIRAGGAKKRGFNAGVKSAAFVSELSATGVRCRECDALMHRNSFQMGHNVDKRVGGDNSPRNAGPAHPYCNSTYKDWKDNQANDGGAL